MVLDKYLLDQISQKAKVNERLRMNLNLHESFESQVQRLLNALEPGTVVPIHRHTHTAETYILLRGRIDVMFYNDIGYEVERFHLNPLEGQYGVQIPKGQWHTLEVLEEGTVIFEVKEGPYKALGHNDIMVEME